MQRVLSYRSHLVQWLDYIHERTEDVEDDAFSILGSSYLDDDEYEDDDDEYEDDDDEYEDDDDDWDDDDWDDDDWDDDDWDDDDDLEEDENG